MKNLSTSQILDFEQRRQSTGDQGFGERLLRLTEDFSRSIGEEYDVHGHAVKFVDALTGSIEVRACFYPKYSVQRCPPVLEHYDPHGVWQDQRAGIVLVCDDDSNVCLLARTAWEQVGLKVLTAGSAEEALEILEGQDVDLLVTDIVLPGMSGHDLITTIRSVERLRRVGIVTISGEADSSTCLSRVTEQQLLFHCAKPADWARLGGVIRDIVSGDAA